MVCPKPSHAHSISGFWRKSRPLASHWRTHSPPAASMPSTCTHYLLAPPHTTVSHGVPETEPRTLSFGFLAQILSLGLALANAQPASMQSMHTHHIQAPPHTYFTRHAQHQATHAQFRVFGPHPTPWLRISKCTAPCRLHAIDMHPLPPSATPHRRFTRYT
jgi:hypothetical protein